MFIMRGTDAHSSLLLGLLRVASYTKFLSVYGTGEGWYIVVGDGQFMGFHLLVILSADCIEGCERVVFVKSF